MLNDIARENRLKDRLEELKMLSLSDAGVHVSGGMFENKEALFSCFRVIRKPRRIEPLPQSEEGGKAETQNEEKSREDSDDDVHSFHGDEKLQLSGLWKNEVLVDLDKYIILCVWIESENGNSSWDARKRWQCDWRYYWDRNYIYFMRHQEEVGKEEVGEKEIEKAEAMEGGKDDMNRRNALQRLNEIGDRYSVIHQKMGFSGWACMEEVRRYKDNSEKLWRFSDGTWKDVTPRVPHKDSVAF